MGSSYRCCRADVRAEATIGQGVWGNIDERSNASRKHCQRGTQSDANTWFAFLDYRSLVCIDLSNKHALIVDFVALPKIIRSVSKNVKKIAENDDCNSVVPLTKLRLRNVPVRPRLQFDAARPLNEPFRQLAKT